ncbi:COP9 signalosome complex subunit 3-like [Mercenaria mercenaria]|uniref:COP9 signalosome complex subunit 3-like n=1 Tax=Mercenaria mercenaria TaxID=6596 RepID=UPI00234F48B7|nr:COP9 signalosome complex subunit 3-like [Mercenaria mercenaria]
MPNVPDFETLFVQTQEFILSCNGEHVRYATDSYADLCHKFTHNLVERKQGGLMIPKKFLCYYFMGYDLPAFKKFERAPLSEIVISETQFFFDLFIREKNLGLVKQCLTSIYKKNIQRLTKTFLTLSLTDMANRVKLSGPKEAEKYVLHMMQKCIQLDAKLKEMDNEIAVNPQYVQKSSGNHEDDIPGSSKMQTY